MRKKEIAERIAIVTGVNSNDVERVINNYHSIIVEGVKAGEEITFRRFGSYSPVTRKAKAGHNFQSGEVIRIPAKKSIRFIPSPNLKKQL